MSKTVLIVDDAYFMRSLLKKALKEAGYEVVGEAKNGKEGIKMYFEFHPDIVTMDINMPDISGIEATKQILSKDPNAKIIAVTGNNNDDIKREILDAGVKEYLQKPFQPAFLWGKLEKMFKSQEGNVEEVTDKGIENTSPVLTEDVVEDDFDNLEIEIRDKPDESKSMTFVIKNEEDHIEFPEDYQHEVENKKEDFKLSKENLERIEENEDNLIEFEDNQTLDGFEAENASPQAHVPAKQPVYMDRTQSSTSPNKEVAQRTEQISQAKRAKETLVSTVEISKSKKTDRKIEEINIRPQGTVNSSGREVNIRPPRGRVLREENTNRFDYDDVEEPILNVSDKNNYNNDKNNGLFTIVKKIFKK